MSGDVQKAHRRRATVLALRPGLFAQMTPAACMSGDVHVQFCERPGVLPRATHRAPRRRGKEAEMAT